MQQRESAILQQIDETEADIAVYRDALRELKEKLRALQSEEANSSQSEEEINALRASAEEELTSQRSQCDRFKAEREEKSRKLHDLEVEYASLLSAVEKEEADMKRLSVEKDELVKRILETETVQKDLEGKLHALEAEAEEKELTEEEKKAVQEIVDKIAALSKEKEEINARQAELEAQKTELQETITKQSDKRYRCEIEISKIDTNLENMRVRIDETYAMDYEACLAFRTENFNVDEAASVISVLKRKITMLGDVNPHAVEEYADEKAHYDEMVTQRDEPAKGNRGSDHGAQRDSATKC